MPAHPAPDYVERLLDLYRRTPGTRGRVRSADRRLATTLQSRALPLETVQHALLLATARRTFRAPDAEPLPPIASLHYFLPVIDEILTTPIEPGYFDYLRTRLATREPRFVAHLDHQLS